jgi:diadenosine tetraphosphatase ApaH/serine/threonine PP2A family protein phosphatase
VVECEPEGRCRFVKQNSVELRPECKYLVNAGSVGQPRDGNPQACGLVYDVETSTLTLVRVTYDVAAVQKKIHAAGLPQFLATRLAVGH